MTRRKQAQPRAFKPEEDTASPSADVARTPEGDRPECGLDLPALPETGECRTEAGVPEYPDYSMGWNTDDEYP
ncbi:hypothetical protein FJT64_004879 [Amphibalanus amphitrite]|uniref:Uncharacterized protein n=1 Tax=Amphibalanus amphitrite TaxID=1232801 RepID=A0A6A4VXS9_AMPAM|nr:hypothetical protein FJT64_004879 [Amphibalanus amphitrite]